MRGTRSHAAPAAGVLQQPAAITSRTLQAAHVVICACPGAHTATGLPMGMTALMGS
jgi:hypothetical protein